MKKAAERLVQLRIRIFISPSKGTFPAVEVWVWPPFLLPCLLVSPAVPPKIVEVSPREREEPGTSHHCCFPHFQIAPVPGTAMLLPGRERKHDPPVGQAHGLGDSALGRMFYTQLFSSCGSWYDLVWYPELQSISLPAVRIPCDLLMSGVKNAIPCKSCLWNAVLKAPWLCFQLCCH